MPRNGTSSRAFTLIELVLVLGIIAMCAMIAIPTLGGFAKGRALPNTAAEFIATTRFCRVRAMTDGVAYRMNFDLNAGKWWVTKDDGTTGTNFIPVTDDELAREFTLPESVQLATDLTPIENELYLGFDPGGRCDVAAFHFTSGTNVVNIGVETPLSTYKVAPSNTGVR